MKKASIKIFLLVFFISTGNIHALNITSGGIEAYLSGEYNRISNYYGDISASGSLELNNLFVFKFGLTLGKSDDNTHIKTHTSAAIIPFAAIPLRFSILYIYNGIPENEYNTHSILPLLSFNGTIAGISLGPGLRFTSFFNESPIFEAVISFSAYINFVNNDSLRIGISIANFSEFQVKNIGAYSLKLNTAVRLDNNWQIINEIEISQSGGMGLSTAFLGFGWRGGILFTW